jgi:hypothetical protein
MLKERQDMKISMTHYKRFYPTLITVTILSSMGLLVWFGIAPFHSLVIGKADRIQEHYVTRENRAAQMKKLPDLQAQFEMIQAEEGVLAILLSEKRVVDFVQTLERLAEETGVHILIRSKTGTIIEEKQKPKALAKKAAAADTAKEEDTPEKKTTTPLTILESVPFDRYLHVEVVVKGEYRTIVTFLHKMETLSLGLDVIGMTMKIRDREDDVKTLPDNPGRNPFLILGGQEVTTDSSTEQNGEVPIPGTLEATFDTVVYLDKQ